LFAWRALEELESLAERGSWIADHLALLTDREAIGRQRRLHACLRQARLRRRGGSLAKNSLRRQARFENLNMVMRA
jgi:hypothetical protein